MQTRRTGRVEYGKIGIMPIKKEIFKEYDIRGLYKKEINEKAAYLIGLHLPSFLKKAKARVVVGRDTRTSSLSLSNAVIKGLTDAGADVFDVGETPSPFLYFAVAKLKLDGGLMITASHNALKYNGIKITRAGALPIGGEELQQLRSFIENRKVATKPAGQVKKINIDADYVQTALGGLKGKRKLKISFEKSGGPIDKLYKKITPLISATKPGKPDLYASFDYDADRLIIKDKNKNIVRGDIIGGIVGDSILTKKDSVAFDVFCSLGVRRHFTNLGIKTLASKVGHYYLSKQLIKNKAKLGVEISGHYHFKYFPGFESPLFALRNVVEQMEKLGTKDINQTFTPFKNYYHSGVIKVDAKNLAQKINKLKDFYKTGAQSALDGLLVEYPNRWWFNIRPSNTEPIARLVVETNSPELLKEKIEEIRGLIK